MAEINFRRRYDLYLTNTKDNSYHAGPYDLLMPIQPSFRGTPRQILDEVANFRRISGGCDIGYRIVDPQTGEEFRAGDIRDALDLRECLKGER